MYSRRLILPSFVYLSGGPTGVRKKCPLQTTPIDEMPLFRLMFMYSVLCYEICFRGVQLMATPGRPSPSHPCQTPRPAQQGTSVDFCWLSQLHVDSGWPAHGDPTHRKHCLKIITRGPSRFPDPSSPSKSGCPRQFGFSFQKAAAADKKPDAPRQMSFREAHLCSCTGRETRIHEPSHESYGRWSRDLYARWQLIQRELSFAKRCTNWLLVHT